jgi:hypothetical protein
MDRPQSLFRTPDQVPHIPNKQREEAEWLRMDRVTSGARMRRSSC